MLKKPTQLAVLVIDDEPLIQWAVSEALSQAGHEVVNASNGNEGLRAVAAAPRPFDVIFLDFRLPDSNDFVLLSTIRTWAPQSVVALMTASHTPDVVTDAYRLGVYRILNKPFDIAEVLSIVAAVSSKNVRGDSHGSTRRPRVSFPVSMDPTWDGNAAGDMDVRNLSAFS